MPGIDGDRPGTHSLGKISVEALVRSRLSVASQMTTCAWPPGGKLGVGSGKVFFLVNSVSRARKR